jgi:AraC family transcriptional regulator, transcriptional activator of the genes for pyochelin and ferripyochelin receptors
MVLSTNQHEELRFTGEVPSELSRHHIPGSKISALRNGHGQLMLQEVDSPSCKLYYSAFRIEKKTVLNIRDDGPFMSVYIALQNEKHLEIEGLGAISLREGQYNLFYAPKYAVSSAHEPGREYISISLRYAMDALEEMSDYFPKVDRFIEKVNKGEPAMLLEDHAWVTREIQDTIFRIVHCSKEQSCYPIFFDLLVKTLLFHLLLQSVQKQPRSVYNHYEISGIHEAREMISRNLKYHYRIPEIAQKVGMNEFKLKNGFREVFGDGLYEYLLGERMRAARNMLHEAGRNIKEIAGLMGYKSVNSFIKAFKRTFNQTPGEFRNLERGSGIQDEQELQGFL